MTYIDKLPGFSQTNLEEMKFGKIEEPEIKRVKPPIVDYNCNVTSTQEMEDMFRKSNSIVIQTQRLQKKPVK